MHHYVATIELEESLVRLKDAEQRLKEAKRRGREADEQLRQARKRTRELKIESIRRLEAAKQEYAKESARCQILDAAIKHIKESD